VPADILVMTRRGADIMVPMAIPSFGGMLVVMISLFVVPVLYCWLKEIRMKPTTSDIRPTQADNGNAHNFKE